ncbi:hypothetical protein NECAME_15222 [Necator americanus]|uniref:Nuclear pore complex protein n=1 Tax=Necator americanus TaxID=51031 RepID=W2SJ27_NECAM|nr:hypothetical protein NECAME_15222 [Necator americanus]ETN69573.1 hypothetical protein NECAME_15222 [Necator americanus]
MRVVQQQQHNAGSDGCSFDELDKAVFEDLHAALSRLLSAEEEYDIWEAAELIFRDYHDALVYLGSQAPAEELKHALGADRCLCGTVIENCLIQDYDRGRGDSFLSLLIAEDRDFRLVYGLWRWCIEGALESSGFADLAHQVKDIKELSGTAKSDMKRMRSSRQLSADPDSMIKAADDPNFDKLIRVVFSLLRCGRFEEAIELSDGMGVPWMTLLIRTQQLLIDPILIGADLTKQEKARLHYRKLTYQVMKKAIAETKYSMGIRMVFAALAGDVQFLLPLATSVEDRVWCYANAAVQARLNNALELDHPVYAPISIEGIFEAITTVETPPYYVLMSYLMRGAWNEAVEWMHEYCKKIEKSGANFSSLYRFFGLVASACRILKYEHDDNYGRELVELMIDSLLQKKLFSLIPFYAALLPKEEAMKKIWSVIPYVRTETDRRRFIHALNKAEFDGENFALHFGRFRIVEDVHHLDCLRWIFICGDNKLQYALAEANSVIRHYLISNLEKDASAVIKECENLKLVDRLASFVRNTDESEPSNQDTAAAGVVIDEFNNHCLYLSAQAHCTTFAMECARAQAAAKKLAEDERAGGEWSRQGDLVGLSQRTARAERNQSLHERSKIALDACKARTFDAVTSFLKHPGWRSSTKKDWARSEQLKALRERFYANILNMLLRDLGMCEDATSILDLLPFLADDDPGLYKDLSKEDLQRFLLDVHTLAGRAME